MATAPLSFPPFDPAIEPHTVGSRWEKWLDRFENYLVAMDITDGKRQKALLLHFAGESVFQTYESLQGEDTTTYEQCKTKLSGHFAPMVHEQYAMFEFHSATQQPYWNYWLICVSAPLPGQTL